MSRLNEMSAEQAAPGNLSPGQHLRQAASQVGEQIRESAREKYDHLKDQAGHYYEEGRRHAREWEQGLEHYVQERPIKSLLIAAGVGVLVGFLMRRS